MAEACCYQIKAVNFAGNFHFIRYLSSQKLKRSGFVSAYSQDAPFSQLQGSVLFFVGKRFVKNVPEFTFFSDVIAARDPLSAYQSLKDKRISSGMAATIETVDSPTRDPPCFKEYYSQCGPKLFTWESRLHILSPLLCSSG